MKKLLSLILILAILFSLCSLAACGEKNKEQKVPENEVENTENTETVEEEEIDIETLKASKPNEYVAEKLEADIRRNSFKLMSAQSKAAAVAAGRVVDISADDFDDEDK